MSADTTAIHPYILGKARYALHSYGLNPDDAGPLAEWAQRAFDEKAERTGVIITRDGQIVAHTHLVTGHVSAWYVTREDAKRLGLSVEEVGHAVHALKRILGQDCGMISYYEVCHGRRAPEVTA